MIAGVLLAAGAGRRFGGDKLLQTLADGTPMALAAARSLLTVLPRVVAVIRPDAPPLHELLVAAGLEVVINPTAERGMGGSLACGVRAAAASGWIIALADMPCIQPATVTAVAQALEQGAMLAAPEYGGRRGHPVGFSHSLRAELAALSGDYGARRVLERHAGQLRRLAVADSGIHIDIDTPADLARLSEKNS